MRRLFDNMDNLSTMWADGGILVGVKFEQFGNRYTKSIRNLLRLLNRGIELVGTGIVHIGRSYLQRFRELGHADTLAIEYFLQFHSAKIKESLKMSNEKLDYSTNNFIFANK